MIIYCQSKEEIIKEIITWINTLEGELKIKITKDKVIEGKYQIYLFDDISQGQIDYEKGDADDYR